MDVLTKLKKDKFYLLNNKSLVKLLKVNEALDVVVIYRYDTFLNDSLSIAEAKRLLTPVFKISEVCRMIGKKPDTLRKYERDGLIESPQKFSMCYDGSRKLRFYSWDDIQELVRFFNGRNRMGRPGDKVTKQKMNEREILKLVEARYEQVKKTI